MPNKKNPEESPNDLLSVDEALEYLDKIGTKTTEITLNKWVKKTKEDPDSVPVKKRLAPAKEFKVGGTGRTFKVFTRKSLDAWEPQSRNVRAPIEKAAEVLGIRLEDAVSLHESKVDGQPPRHVVLRRTSNGG